MTSKTRKISFFFLLGLFSLGSLSLTGLISLNAYELAFNRDIQLSTALSPVSIETILNSNGPDTDYFDESREGNFGQPIQLKAPTTNSRLEIIPGILDSHHHWLARANTGHYLIIGPSKNGNAGDLIIYLRESWRTVKGPERIKEGDNLFLDTIKGWRYMYRVNEVSTRDATSGYVIDQTLTSKLILVVSNDKNRSNTVVNANFVTIQNIRQ